MLGDPQIKGALPRPSNVMMVLTVISVVIIIGFVVWSGHVAAQEVDTAESASEQE